MPRGNNENDEYERAAEFFNRLYNEALQPPAPASIIGYYSRVEDVPQQIMDAFVEDILDY